MKTSKTICRLLLAAGTIAGAFVTETSCTKQGLREGDAIHFSASNSAARTRTSYSKEGSTGSDGLLYLERIDWKEGDLITIYSPQAVMADETDPVCDYRVDSHETLSGNLMSRATVMPSVSGKSLGWGSGTHYFYAVYPSAETEAFTAAEKAKTGLDDTQWKGTVAAVQSPSANGLVGTASAPEILAKMQYAHMFATATYDTDAPSVDLPFFPEFTAFEFQVGSGKNPVVDLTSFTLTAAAGQNALAGDFAYLLADVDTETASDPLALSKFAFSNTSQSITVDFTTLSAGRLTVESGKPVTFTVVALPQDLSGLSITFTGDEIGTRTLRLNDSAGTPLVYAARQKHRIYGLSFPTVVAAWGEEIEWDQEALGEDILWDPEPEYVFGSLPDATTEGLSDVTVAYPGGDGSFATSFVSYKTYDGGATKTAVPFTLEYSKDGGNTWSAMPPSWLAPDSGIDYNGSTTGEALSVTVLRQVSPDPHHDALVAKGTYYGSDYKDLSTIDVSTGGTVTRTTANCYVVDRPGNYKFPLVYGNGVKNGSVNESAFRAKAGVDATDYRSDDGEPGYLGRFKDHLDRNIMSPYLTTHLGKAPGDFRAVLLWQDVQGLVTVYPNISGYREDAYILFTVPSKTITQGNALIAVLVDDDNNGTFETVAWSWHVWVTEEDLSAVKEGSNGNYFAPVDIGWCEGKTETYAARTCQVRATQAGSGLARTATLTQTAGSVVVTGGNSPYYQWGRKDPLQASDGMYDTNIFKTYYPSEYADAPAVADGPVSIGAAIRSPYTFYTKQSSPYVWCSTTYHNHWSSTINGYNGTGQNANAKTKTVYDPSPVGFRVPAQDAWAGFDTSNFTWGAVGGDDGRTYGPSGLFFPASGRRDRRSSGGINNVGIFGYFWSSSPGSAAGGLYLDFNNSRDVISTASAERAFGFPVRCVKE